MNEKLESKVLTKDDIPDVQLAEGIINVNNIYDFQPYLYHRMKILKLYEKRRTLT